MTMAAGTRERMDPSGGAAERQPPPKCRDGQSQRVPVSPVVRSIITDSLLPNITETDFEKTWLLAFSHSAAESSSVSGSAPSTSQHSSTADDGTDRMQASAQQREHRIRSDHAPPLETDP